MKKLILKTIPYVASLIVGFILYFIAGEVGEDCSNLNSLIINISAAFFAIPLIFLSYQLTDKYAKKKLNKEIFDYAKVQVDTEVLSLIKQLMKIVYPLQEIDSSYSGVVNFISIDRTILKDIVSTNIYTGFSLFKVWDVNENHLHDILKNPYIIEKFEDEQILSVIEIIKNIRRLKKVNNSYPVFKQDNGNLNHMYKIQKGAELNPGNSKYPDRYLLLKKIEGMKYQVVDFGDFAKYNIDKLLLNYKINKELLELYTDAIYEMLFQLKNWIDITGKEFLVDTQVFKPIITTIIN